MKSFDFEICFKDLSRTDALSLNLGCLRYATSQSKQILQRSCLGSPLDDLQLQHTISPEPPVWQTDPHQLVLLSSIHSSCSQFYPHSVSPLTERKTTSIIHDVELHHQPISFLAGRETRKYHACSSSTSSYPFKPE